MLLITIMSRTPSSGRQPVKRQNHYMYHTQVHYNSEKLGFMALIFPIRKAPGKAIGPLPKVAKKKKKSWCVRAPHKAHVRQAKFSMKGVPGGFFFLFFVCFFFVLLLLFFFCCCCVFFS